MLDRLFWTMALLLLRLRYRIRVRGLDEIAARGRGGIFFLPNHPALIDPIILMTVLRNHGFEPGALADKDQIDRPVIRSLAKRAGVRPTLDVARYGGQAREQVARVLRECAEGLKRGESLMLYPSGHLYRSRFESLRGNSAVETVLREAPQARVVLVRTTGLWGSSFGMIRGDYPKMGRVLWFALLSLIANVLMFGPRRDVLIEFAEPGDLPRGGPRSELNAYLERYYNEKAPPGCYVPYSFWEPGGVRELPDPDFGGVTGDPSQVPESTRKIVYEFVAQLSKTEALRDDMNLATDLGLDSLSRTELLLWLGREFGFAAGDASSLRTVGDVLLAARGQAGGGRPVALKPIPSRWFANTPGRRLSLSGHATITQAFLAQARRRPGRAILADQLSGVRSYRELITAIMVLKPHFEKLPGDYVGILLPASVPASVTYMACLFAGKTPLLLNWTTGARNMLHALDLVGAQRVITVGPLVGRIESLGTDMSGMADRLVRLEELGKRITRAEKLRAWLASRLSWRRLARVAPREVAAVLLTSGSESLPKAVPLTHANILTNIRDVLNVIAINDTDRMVGFLPPFHSFGLTVTLIAPLLAGFQAVYHANPTEPWVLAQLIEAYRATLLVGTPTFVSGVVRASRPGQLATLRLAVTGAEKCPDSTYDALAAACPGMTILEGYGITECSPIVAATRTGAAQRGTIGLTLPSVEYAIVDVDRNQRVEPGRTGILLVRGASVFDGYLGQNTPSPFVDFEGRTWYRTGDLVSEDADRVLTFRGRLKRFVKLGGEMVSLPAIESVLEQHYGGPGDDGPVIAVEAASADEHPELVLFTTRDLDRQTVNRQIREAGLSALHNLTRVVKVEHIPVLGTGKTDYRSLRDRLSAKHRDTEAQREKETRLQD